MRLRATYDGKVLVPVDSVDLPQGQVLDLDVTTHGSVVPRTDICALLDILRSPPHIDPELVAEMERLIEEGQSPSGDAGVFDDLAD